MILDSGRNSALAETQLLPPGRSTTLLETEVNRAWDHFQEEWTRWAFLFDRFRGRGLTFWLAAWALLATSIGYSLGQRRRGNIPR